MGDGTENGSLKTVSVKDDPENLITLLDKYVEINLIKSSSFCGFVHSVDPITKSVILLVPCSETFKTYIVPGHNIMEISEKSAPENVKVPLRRPIFVTEEAASLRKNKLLAWMKLNLLPVSEEGPNLVVGSAKVLPPYGPTDVYAENAVVALQIKNIMERIPEYLEASDPEQKTDH